MDEIRALVSGICLIAIIVCWVFTIIYAKQDVEPRNVPTYVLIIAMGSFIAFMVVGLMLFVEGVLRGIL